jgi:hypothetical protein
MIYQKDGFAPWNVAKKRLTPIYLFTLLLLASCATTKKAALEKPTGITALAKTAILDKPEFKAAHAGISIYDPQEKKMLFSYQDD